MKKKTDKAPAKATAPEIEQPKRANTPDAPVKVKGKLLKPKKCVGRIVKVDEQVDKILRIYSHMSGLWITENGFVHDHQVPGSKYFKNKYYNK